MNLFHLRQLMAIFCALWILTFMGLSTINERPGDISIFDSSELKTILSNDERNNIYSEDPLERYMHSLTEISEDSDSSLDEKIESILASDVPPIRLAELVK